MNTETSKNTPPSKAKNIIILLNLGSPATPSVSSVRRYLFEFLMDPLVIDIPFLWRFLLVGGIIAPFRSFSSAKAYKAIWQHKPSPLLHLTNLLAKKLFMHLKADPSYQESLEDVLVAMRYQEPSLSKLMPKILAIMRKSQHRNFHLRFIPLYPHYAMSTSLSSYKQIHKDYKRLFANVKKLNKKAETKANIIDIQYSIQAPFYKDPKYLHALEESLRPYVQDLGKKNGYDFLLFSYHGLPVRHLRKATLKGKEKGKDSQGCLDSPNCCTDANRAWAHTFCYRHQVLETSKEMIQRLALDESRCLSSFQSRLGKDPWTTPFTSDTLVDLAKKGVKRLLIACPAFVSDNLETLFEIAIENKEIFLEAGGEELKLIPCLNLSEPWISALAALAKSHTTLSN